VVSSAGQRFGRRLRHHRESRTITLEAIAAATKIRASLFAELERGEVSTWPAGIFRRAFVREYAAAIGLPPEAIVAEFVQLFPDADSKVDVAAPPPASDLRLTLATDRWQVVSARLNQIVVAVLEAGLLVATAGLVAWFAAASFWPICAATALLYYSLATAVLGRSPASWGQQGGLHAWRKPHAVSDSTLTPSPRDLIHLVTRTAERRTPRPEEPAETATAPPLRAASS
jgi:transcriptional regulator with XRE-family HTH domain